MEKVGEADGVNADPRSLLLKHAVVRSKLVACALGSYVSKGSGPG